MNKFFITVVLFFAIYTSNSQDIAVRSFRKLEMDQEARIISPIIDQNGKKCAIFKVVTSQTGFAWDFGMIGTAFKTEQKTGEIWVWVPVGTRKVTINHQQLGVLRNYQFDIDIEEATVYEMILITGKVTTIVEETIGSEWVVVSSDPPGADVYIDDKATGMQTPFTRQYPLGSHSYRVSMDLYHPDAGKFELTPDGGKKKIVSTLLPAFGQLKLTSLPESGANIVLDGKPLTQTTPCTIEKIKSGTYPLILSKTLFHETTQTITITDGQTTNADVILKPAFGSIEITSLPESGAAVTLDDVPTGKVTPCTLDKVPSGVRNISLRLNWYQPIKKQLTVTDGEKATLEVPMNELFGTVSITTKPEADIYKDNEKLATGTYSGRLNEGVYTFEARKPKHTTDTQKIQIATGDQKNITLAPRPQMGIVEIQSTPIDAVITLDGENKGTTPATLRSLLVGDYNLTLSFPGYATINKTITITEGQTAQINETLVNGRAVTINTEPAGVTLSIDGNTVGQTPYSGSLTFGNHILQIQQGDKKAEKTVSISQTGGETSFSLSFGPETFMESVNGIGIEMVIVKGGTFSMGSDDFGPIHSVTLSVLNIGKTEVTQAQWKAVMGNNPSYFKGDNLPVESVSWEDVQVFIGKLNASGKIYRLPTEAEWEYAAQGGVGQEYAGTNTESSLGSYAWYSANSGSKTQPAGTKEPNQFGLYDMSGNVWEWCSDWYGSYSSSPQTNPKGPSSGSGRVLRGGSYINRASLSRVSLRNDYNPGGRINLIGFRLVRVF